MRVVMRIGQEWQDAGQPKRLEVGQTYEVPEPVGRSLVSAGIALEPVRETARMAVPERKGRRS